MSDSRQTRFSQDNSTPNPELSRFYDQTKPTPVPGIDIHDLDQETLIYSVDLEVSVTLNVSAQAIWNLCDGQLSITEIIAALAQRYGLNPAEIVPDIVTTITRLQQVGLLELSTQFEQRSH
jgi:hypothetical protein